MSTAFSRVNFDCGSFDAFRASRFAQRFPAHFHETFALGVVESGATRLWTRRGEFMARAGTILAFAPGEIHAADPIGVDGYTYRMIYPCASVMREIGAEAVRFDSPVFEDPRLGRALARAADDERQFVSAMRALVARHGIAALATRSEERIVEETRHYLEMRFAEPVRLTQIAERLGVTQFRLIKVFRRAVGVPPYKYLVQLRVNRAQAMLCAGAPVADVAYACGFSDQAHLTRTFKRAVGVPPGKYAVSLRGSG